MALMSINTSILLWYDIGSMLHVHVLGSDQFFLVQINSNDRVVAWAFACVHGEAINYPLQEVNRPKDEIHGVIAPCVG